MQTRCTKISDKPMARPAKFPAPFSLSVVPKTTNTNTNVKMISAIKPPSGVMPGWTILAPVPINSV